jgi:hypothetical protein
MDSTVAAIAKWPFKAIGIAFKSDPDRLPLEC